jgi:hypothetical protein
MPERSPFKNSNPLDFIPVYEGNDGKTEHWQRNGLKKVWEYDIWVSDKEIRERDKLMMPYRKSG